jgi:hypothetical protein
MADITWHPILAAVESPTGTWRMIDSLGTEYGQIEIRRVRNGTYTRYRATFRTEVIGWSASLRTACEKVHRAYLATMGPSGGARADWGEKTGHARNAAASRPA